MEYVSLPAPLIIGIGVIILFGVFVIVFGSKPQKSQKAMMERLYRKTYEFFSSFFLTSGRIKKITDQLAALSIYNRGELQQLSTKYFLMSTLISLALVVVSFFLYKDTISILVCLTFAVILNTIMVDKQVEKINKKVYTALKHAVSAIRQEYLRLGSIPEAVAEADIPQVNLSY